ncbi:MAG: pyridoxal phosphate-dependent decarboxylase family protein [Methylobacter sp.]
MTASSQDWATHFIGPKAGSETAYQDAMAAAIAAVNRNFASLEKPYSGRSAQDCAEAVSALDVCPETGKPLADVMAWVNKTILAHSVAVSHPLCAAHLHCPPLIPALAAEVLISATNQSMDSWDQAPAATYLEQKVASWLAGLVGYSNGDGIFTSGGTQSNFMGLLLAREAAGRQCGLHIQQDGVSEEARRFRILCSEGAHFSVRQSAALLGLGEQAVVPVKTDSQHRLSPEALEATIASLKSQGLRPIAVVATAGTTDFGAIDPLSAIANICREHSLWMHIDAAYGGALLLSDRHAERLNGLSEADSVTVDFHKLFYQPISCGAFLVKNPANFDFIHLQADYLNPPEHEFEDILDLVGKSIQTTRRFDGLKLFMSLQTIGRKTLAAMIETSLKTAETVAKRIAEDSEFEVLNPKPSLNAVVFRYLPESASDEDANRINAGIRSVLMLEGTAVIAQTRVQGRVCLKFTLLNPKTRLEDIEGVLASIKRIGKRGVSPVV